MLKDIGIVDFVLVELAQYLDTHPFDRNAMEYFTHYSKIKEIISSGQIGDVVTINGTLIEPKQEHIVLLFNKPVGVTCTTEHHIKDNIIDFIHYHERIFPIGRLDKDSSGLILLTNNGDLVNDYSFRGNKRFENMELLTRPYEGIFISEIILGGLGAIMDISISISSSLNEMLQKDPKITSKQLIKSGFNIGRDIMSTMINVLFFTYICSVIPNLTILFRNGINLSSLINSYITLEMTRALIGAIGITITIPISVYTTVFMYKRRDTK